ncbi:beta-lactamase/transpeptidase-like protein [Mycena galopus ATCC 62051]|nr:beta-lactamase/transpeptidase-like protein [Mycena galopus ATCC 62051]KAF8141100.1 beta-lactamase/transpeptidase-like protein [Mycena galopus ATCC 62051]
MDSFEKALADATNPSKRELLGAIGLVVDSAGKVLYHHAAGNQSLSPSTPPLDPNSTFTLGSAGKFIAHIAALQCVERKLLSLDDPLSPWIPELEALQVIESSDAEPGFALRPPTGKITLRHLLTHTSGFGGGDERLIELWRASPAGVAHAAANADAHPIVKNFALPLLFDPGAGYCYGGSAYFTGLLLTRLNTDTGLTTAEFMQANIFDPLGMERSTLAPQTREDVRKQLLQMVQRTPEGLVPVEQETRDMAVSASDLGVLLADLISPSGSKILTPASVDLLFAPQLSPGSKALADINSEKERENYAAPAGIGAAPEGLAVNWSMAGLVVEGDAALPVSKIPPGTVTWNGMPNVVWAMNRARGVGMLFATQLVPVDDEKAVAVMMEFLKGAWATYGTIL